MKKTKTKKTMKKPKTKNNIIKLVLSLLVCLSAGFIGSFFTRASVSTWYLTLNKPVFNPPNWLFGPVWTGLYLLMGYSLYLIWKQGIKKKQSKIAITLFGIQLALNTLWSIIFFGLRSLLFSFIEIVVLWTAILFTIKYFYRLSRTASYLLIPYILWVGFAAVLNFCIFYLN